jgi:hypothetical protein
MILPSGLPYLGMYKAGMKLSVSANGRKAGQARLALVGHFGNGPVQNSEDAFPGYFYRSLREPSGAQQRATGESNAPEGDGLAQTY